MPMGGGGGGGDGGGGGGGGGGGISSRQHQMIRDDTHFSDVSRASIPQDSQLSYGDGEEEEEEEEEEEVEEPYMNYRQQRKR